MTVERASKVIGICPSALHRLNNSEKLFTSSLSRLTFGECHHRLCTFRPLRGVLARRRKGGAGPAPAGVVRSCTPGRTPEKTPSATTGPPWVRAPWNAKAGKAGGALDRRVPSSCACSGAPRPLTLGEGKKRRANPKPDQTWGRLSLAVSQLNPFFSVRPRGSGGPGVKCRRKDWVPACARTNGGERL